MKLLFFLISVSKLKEENFLVKSHLYIYILAYDHQKKETIWLYNIKEDFTAWLCENK